MEENEDQPDDVRNATPVEGEIQKSEIDEQSAQPSSEYESRKVNGQQSSKEVPKKPRKLEKTKEDHCAKRLKKKTKEPKGPAMIKVLVNYKPCTLPRIDPVPRHCLSRKEWMDLLATPSRKCPPPCRKKEVERKLRPISPRINELALPTRQRIMTTLQDRGEILPAELVDKLITMVEGGTCLTPEQAERLFRDTAEETKRPRRTRKSKCKTSEMKTSNKSDTSHSLIDKDAVTCQYLMAESFVKSLLQWKCSLPKREFKDIANIIIQRLSTTLQYTPVDDADRTTQQMKFLADIIAAWIADVLSEVAEIHRVDLEKECEERKKIKDEEETKDDTEESDEDEFIPPKIKDPKSSKAIRPPGSKEDKEDEDTESKDKKDEHRTSRDEKKDHDGDDGGSAGSSRVPESSKPSKDSPEPPTDHTEPPISKEALEDLTESSKDEAPLEATELSPDETSQYDTDPSPDKLLKNAAKPSPDGAFKDDTESSLHIVPKDDIESSTNGAPKDYTASSPNIVPKDDTDSLTNEAPKDFTESSPNIVPKYDTESLTNEAPKDYIESSPNIVLKGDTDFTPDGVSKDDIEQSTEIDKKSPEDDEGQPLPSGEVVAAGILPSDNQEDDQSVAPTTIPSAIVPPVESEIGEIPQLSGDPTSSIPGSTLAIPVDPDDTSIVAEDSITNPNILPISQDAASEKLIPLELSDTPEGEISTVKAAKSELKPSTVPIPLSTLPTEPITPTPILQKPSEDLTKVDESFKLSASEIRAQELSKAGISSSKFTSFLPSQKSRRKAQQPGEKDSDFIEGNLKKMLQTDVPFLDLLKIFDRIENAVANEKENQGEDLMTDRIHRAIYEKLERLVKAETPERLTPHLEDVLDVLSGKIAQWVRNILTDSEILFLNENPPMVESGELRTFGEWIGEMSERVNSWTVWMQNMINELMKMQANQVTRADWQNWTRNFAKDALKWRRYYLESVHYAHHNRTMLAGREVVKTGEMRYPEWIIQEREIKTIDFLQE